MSGSAKNSAPLLEVENVHAGYIKDVDILQGVNFRVEPGELVTVIGPNGAGKSTLAKTIFGLLTPHTGTITFKGENIAGLKVKSNCPKGNVLCTANCQCLSLPHCRRKPRNGGFCA